MRIIQKVKVGTITTLVKSQNTKINNYLALTIFNVECTVLVANSNYTDMRV